MRSLFLCFAAGLAAQETTFRATVPVVLVPVTVADQRGKLVDGLGEADFVVTDGGRRVTFRVESPDLSTAPLALMVAVQTNDLSAAALLKIRKIGSMVQPVITGERGTMALLTVDDRVTVSQEFTADPTAMAKAFERLEPGRSRSAVLLDAAARAVELFRARPSGERRVLLLIGEAKDRGSAAKLEAVLEQLQRENIQVYSATYSAMRTQFTTRASERPRPSGGENDIFAGLAELVRLGSVNTAEALSVHTGGRKLAFTTLRALEGIVMRVGEELHGQYLISFPASGPDGFHGIGLTLRDADKRAVVARQGYWFSSPP